MTGTVISFDESHGYGFIEDSNGQRYFTFFRSIVGRQPQVLYEGEQVTFLLAPGPNGDQAVNVTPVDQSAH